MSDSSLPLFVYGTLKRGESRDKQWPFAPLKVCPATTCAALYDLGPYPAIGPGNDCVAGELWFVRDEHLAATLRQLDAIEGYQQGGPDLYVRRIITCSDNWGWSHRAYAYFFADARRLATFRRISPSPDGRCSWTGKK